LDDLEEFSRDGDTQHCGFWRRPLRARGAFVFLGERRGNKVS
jgi:hypothetical protein